jgi:hypothetical protein
MNKVTAIFILVIVLALIGVRASINDDKIDYENQLRENELMRKKLKQKMHSVDSLRIAISEQRKLYEEQITESMARYKNLESEHKKNEARFQKELETLKKSTVKDLEDEAERIYSAGCKH